MMKKAKQGFIKYYQQEQPWFSREEYLQEQIENFQDYDKLMEESPAQRLKRYFHIIDNCYLLGVYESFKKSDWMLLNNAIYQHGRYRILDILEDGYDQAGAFWNILDGMACNDVELLEKAMPRDLGYAKTAYPAFVIAMNLLYSLWYGEEKTSALLVEKAKKMLGQKKSQWEKAIVAYLLAIHEQDMVEAGRQLNQVCLASRRIEQDKSYKFFCLEAHGLLNIARLVLPEHLFEQIKWPEDEGFLDEFAQWQKENNYPKGQLWMIYPEPLKEMNKILESPIPTCSLKGTGKDGKLMLRDCEAMRNQLLEVFKR